VQRYSWPNVRGVLVDLYQQALRQQSVQAPAV